MTDAPTTVDFVIVTALEEERMALLAKLSGYRKLDTDGRDANVYYEAEVPTRRADRAVYRVIVTSLRGMGPIHAAGLAKEIVERWQPRHVLMVGIAGGVSGEVQLGDVVVASHVMDYTAGKQRDEGREIRWEEHQADAVLFGGAHNFPAGWEAGIAVDSPEPRAHPVARVIGRVASGGDVIASEQLVQAWRRERNRLIAVEMEGSGLAAGLHGTVARPRFLMIRGISDLADATGNAETKARWRSYACHAAAAYAVGLLREGIVPASLRANPDPRVPASMAPPRSLPTEDRARRIATSILGGHVGAIKVVVHPGGALINLVAHRRDDVDDPFGTVHILEAFGNTYRSVWSLDELDGLHSIDAVDIDGDGFAEIVVRDGWTGTAGQCIDLTFFFPRTRESYVISESMDFDLDEPAAPSVGVTPEPPADVRAAIESYAVGQGLLDLVEVDVDAPAFATERWHIENGQRVEGPIVRHDYRGVPQYNASMAEQLETEDAVWTSVFKGPLICYEKTADRHHVVFSPGDRYGWVTALAWDGATLWFANQIHEGLFHYTPATSQLGRIRGGAVPASIESITFVPPRSLRLNDTVDILLPVVSAR